MAKQIIAQWDEIELPEHVVVVEHHDRWGRPSHAEERLPGTTFRISHGRLEADLDGFRPDVLLEDHDGMRIAIEVRVTHAVGDTKQQRVQKSQVPMLEFDLSCLPRIGIDERQLREELVRRTPIWIYHPEEEKVRRRLHAGLMTVRDSRLSAIQSEATIPAAGKVSQQPSDSQFPTSVTVFEPQRGLFRRDDPPARATRLADFIFMGTEVRIRSHDLLDAIVVWARTSNTAMQDRVLRILAADARGAGLTCSTHTTTLGYLIGWGAEATAWAQRVDGHVLAGTTEREKRKKRDRLDALLDYLGRTPPDRREPAR